MSKRKSAKRTEGSALERALEGSARAVTNWTGSTGAFALSVSIVVGWVLTGPLFHYSDTWQLVINTSTTIVTFLMVFLIQRSQNKDSLALHLKLNEIVAAVRGASNRLIDVEALSERELQALHQHYETLAKMAKKDLDRLCSHSIEEAEHRHRRKVLAQAADHEPKI
jgi:low affinity Fe/Cu permease